MSDGHHTKHSFFFFFFTYLPTLHFAPQPAGPQPHSHIRPFPTLHLKAAEPTSPPYTPGPPGPPVSLTVDQVKNQLRGPPVWRGSRPRWCQTCSAQSLCRVLSLSLRLQRVPAMWKRPHHHPQHRLSLSVGVLSPIGVL